MVDGPASLRLAAGRQPHARRPGRSSGWLLRPAVRSMRAMSRRRTGDCKPQRQHRIGRLLEEHAVTSQGQLVELLAADGVAGHAGDGVARPRGARRRQGAGAGGETVYAIPELPKDQRAPEDHLRRVLGDWVVDVSSSGNLVVVRTPPGSAHVVGSALDRAGLARRPRHRRRRRHRARGRATSPTGGDASGWPASSALAGL